MIDRYSRNTLALAIRRFAAGRICAIEFLSATRKLDASEDKVVQRVVESLEPLALENEFDDGYLRGELRLNCDGRRVFAKFWLLLMSDTCGVSGAEWPVHKPFIDPPPVSVLTRIANFDLCGARRTRARELRKLRNLGPSRRAWPFPSNADLQTARRQHIYLSGTCRTA